MDTLADIFNPWPVMSLTTSMEVSPTVIGSYALVKLSHCYDNDRTTLKARLLGVAFASRCTMPSRWPTKIPCTIACILGVHPRRASPHGGALYSQPQVTVRMVYAARGSPITGAPDVRRSYILS
jgi:hypothetical protein